MRKVISTILVLMIIVFHGAYADNASSTLQEMYAQAELLMATGDYSGAAMQFENLGAYSDASQMAMYCKAVAAAESYGLYSIAVEAFENLGDFKDSKQMSTYYIARSYQAAAETVDVSSASDNDLRSARSDSDQAFEIYSRLALFKDCLTRMDIYIEALALEKNGDYQKAIETYKQIEDYKDSKSRITACEEAIEKAIIENTYQKALMLQEQGSYQEAIDIYMTIQGYKDSKERIDSCENAITDGIYQEAVQYEENRVC